MGSALNNIWTISELAYRLSDADSVDYYIDQLGAGTAFHIRNTLAGQSAAGTLKPVIYSSSNSLEYDWYSIRKDTTNKVSIVMDTPPIIYHPFDDADISGGEYVDRMGNTNVTIVSATTGVAGTVNEACSFDGSTSNLVSAISDFFTFSKYEPFAVGFFVKTVDASTTMVSAQGYPNTGGWLVLSVAGGVRFYMSNYNESQNQIVAIGAPPLINDGNWHFVIVARDDSNTAAGMTIDLDGDQRGLAYLATADPGHQTVDANPLAFGGFINNGVMAPDFAGDMDEFMLFDTVPSPQQRKWIYDQLIAGNQPW
jgi:hypothetical protein